MSSARRDTAAARAALARRRHRGVFTPSPTSSNAQQQQQQQQQQHNQSFESSATWSTARPKSLPPKAPDSASGTTALTAPSSSAAVSHRADENRARATSAPASTPTKTKLVPSAKSNGRSVPSSTVRFQASDLEQEEDENDATNDRFAHDARLHEEDDDKSMVEEPEPVVVGKEILDATRLDDSSSIAIRSMAAGQFLTVAKKQRGEALARFLASTSSDTLITESHVFSITRIGDSSDDKTVRFGDVIVLQSSDAAGQGRALGVRRLSANEMSGVAYELGFYRQTPSLAEHWTVVSAGRVVLVGSAALKATPKRVIGKAAAVRSGDPLVLRNNLTGGLLAVDNDNALSLVTDSYDASNALIDALDRIQHHDRIVPSSNETFQFLHSEVPLCPQWTDDCRRRMYDNGSYLLHKGRNDRNEASKVRLFGRPLRDGRTSLQAPIKSGSVTTQERILLDDVIGSFFGLEGHYVKYQGKGVNLNEMHYRLSEPNGASFDTSLKNLVNRILPLSTAFVRVRSFLSLHRPGYQCGFVVQAASESVDSLLQDHLSFGAEMERLFRLNDIDDPLTMSKLYVHVQVPIRSMLVLEQVTNAIREYKGGALLNSLHELKTRPFSGDDIAQRVLDPLLQKASIPYFQMLETWLESGVVDDPFGEFMVEMKEQPVDVIVDGKGGYDGDVWNDIFQIRSEHVLNAFLSSQMVQNQILLTGKYWNAVQLCPRTGMDEMDDDERLASDAKVPSQLNYGMDSVAISTYVRAMYRKASQRLIRLLFRDFGIMETLQTMKRYFLFHQGDFLMYLFDAAEDELLLELPEVSRGRMQHWLGMCVHLTEPNTSDAASSVLTGSVLRSAGSLTAEMLRCSFPPESLLDHLDALHAESGGIDANEPKTPSRHPYGLTNKGITGVESLTLQFDRIPFPTSLILSQRALSSYQLLFRHLFFAKHVERRLVGVWLDHQMMKQFQTLRRAMGPTYCLRQRMLHFMQNFIYYMMFEVIEPNWLEMETAIRKQQLSGGEKTVDDIVKVHNEFLDLAMAECLLTNRDLIRSLTKLMTTCLLFSEQLSRFMKATKIEDENQLVANQKRSKIQRNINDPAYAQRQQSKKALRKAMITENEERKLRMNKQAARVERELANESYKRMIERFDEVFSENLARFMKQLLAASDEHHSQKANLCIRLDYNGYVTKQMGLQ